MRVGQGYDVHALVEGRKLVIGGVAIPHHKGLAGHSDADVLLHAICDALLGAAAMGDIGSHIDSDPQQRGGQPRTACPPRGRWRGPDQSSTSFAHHRLGPSWPARARIERQHRPDLGSNQRSSVKATRRIIGATSARRSIAAQAIALSE